MKSPNKKPRAANAGRKKLNRKTCLSRILTRIPYLCQVFSYHADGESVEKQRAEEKPRVYKVQLDRVRKQIRAFHEFGDVGRWPEIATDE